jgi:hypothetical protein
MHTVHHALVYVPTRGGSLLDPQLAQASWLKICLAGHYIDSCLQAASAAAAAPLHTTAQHNAATQAPSLPC